MQAFLPEEYDKGIAATLPYYEDIFLQIAEIARVSFGAPATWLDVGCGTGKMACTATGYPGVQHMVCCDNSPRMLRAARERIRSSNIAFLEASIQDLRYDSEFDVVSAVLVNHYLTCEDRAAGIRNCYKALKKNGLLFTVENFAPNSDVMERLYLERWKMYQRNHGKDEKECEEHIRRYNTAYFPITVAEQIDLLRECGFAHAEIFWCSYMQVGILGIK